MERKNEKPKIWDLKCSDLIEKTVRDYDKRIYIDEEIFIESGEFYKFILINDGERKIMKLSYDLVNDTPGDAETEDSSYSLNMKEILANVILKQLKDLFPKK